jgi:hypothetical protein
MAGHLSAVEPVVRRALQWWVQPAQEQVRQQSISGVVGKLCAQSGRFDLAEPLFELARQEASRFSSGRLDYTLALLNCRRQLHGGLSDADRALAKQALVDGRALAEWDEPETAHLTLFFVGSLFSLVGDHAEGIPYLEGARTRGGPRMRQRADLALIRAHFALDQIQQVRRIIAEAHADGVFTPAYAAAEQHLRQKPTSE